MTQTPNSTDINRAIRTGAGNYFAHCRQRVPGFVRCHFRYPGAWQTNRVALGWDIVRAPLNLFWAPMFALLCLVRFGLRKAGYVSLSQKLANIPDGLTTQVQKHLATRVYSELLALDERGNELEKQLGLALQELYNTSHFNPSERAQFCAHITPIVHEALMQYRITRTASSDITNTLASTLIGAFAFNKFTPGGIGVGLVLAGLMAKYVAVKTFLLGDTLGTLYYSAFPPQPDASLTAGSLVVVMVILSAFASFSGLITDPVQAHLKIHQRRLNRLIDHLEQDFMEKTSNSFRPKDQYIARILDLFDVIKSHLH